MLVVIVMRRRRDQIGHHQIQSPPPPLMSLCRVRLLLGDLFVHSTNNSRYKYHTMLINSSVKATDDCSWSFSFSLPTPQNYCYTLTLGSAYPHLCPLYFSSVRPNLLPLLLEAGLPGDDGAVLVLAVPPPAPISNASPALSLFTLALRDNSPVPLLGKVALAVTGHSGWSSVGLALRF